MCIDFTLPSSRSWTRIQIKIGNFVRLTQHLYWLYFLWFAGWNIHVASLFSQYLISLYSRGLQMINSYCYNWIILLWSKSMGWLRHFNISSFIWTYQKFYFDMSIYSRFTNHLNLTFRFFFFWWCRELRAMQWWNS